MCRNSVSADPAAGGLFVDLNVVGTKEPCLDWFDGCWEGRFTPRGGWGYAILWSDQKLSEPVSSITFTIVVDTQSSAEAFGDASASAYLRLSAGASCAPSVCEGSVVTELTSSSSQPYSASIGRTLTFTMKERYGGKIPAGNVATWVTLIGSAAGLGTSRATADAKVMSISSSIQP